MIMVSWETRLRGWLALLPRSWQRGCYRLAYAGLRLWWFLRRADGRGAGIALWHGPNLLLIRTSYRRHLDLPGGGIEPGEAVMTAALRELGEEVGIRLEPADLGQPVIVRFHFESRSITSTVFPVELAVAPAPRIDQAEIIWAGFVEPGTVARSELAPGLLAYLDQRSHAM